MPLLPPEEKLYALGRFYPGEANRLALDAAIAFSPQNSPTAFVVVGQPKSGKTHLLKGMLLKAKKGAYLNARELAEKGEAELAGLFGGLARLPLVCIDDLDAPKEGTALYDALFTLFNALRDAGGHLAVSLKSSPAKAALPAFLASRLLTGMVVTLKRPGDADRKRILQKIAQDRHLSLTPKALAYILDRSGRSIGDLLTLVDALEEALPPGAKRIGLQLIQRVILSKS